MGTGKRDFGSEFNAKLEKHIERLPDYAQRAQEKLQKYLPPQGEGTRPSSSGRQAPRPAARPPMRAPIRMPGGISPAVIPAVAEVRTKWAAWNEPAAKLERRKRRASRALTLWIVLVLLCGLYGYLAFTGMLGTTSGDISRIIYPSAGVIVFGALGVRSGARLVQLKRVKLPAGSAPPPPLPAAGSVAREPMERLAECEASLAELLAQLSAPAAVGTTAIPAVSVEDARATATEAAVSLRGLAARIVAIERARNASPASERGALDAAIRTLREQLDDGLEGYGGLVAAAGHAVGASGGSISKQALTDATDHLAGLAMALRELS
jgi:hypothetical protein